VREAEAAHQEAGPLPYDQALFEELRALRRRIAAERDVPPFVIFGDATLREMAALLPQSLESFARIRGVGERKLADLGDAFLEVVRRYANEHGLPEQQVPSRQERRRSRKPRQGSTQAGTLLLLSEGLNIGEIADRRGISHRTVLNHLERLDGAGEDLELDHVMPPPHRFVRIEAAFRSAGGSALRPVYELLGEAYSYEEIQLVRLRLKKGN
jgi:ATP-dependent DNA helicase RecQ